MAKWVETMCVVRNMDGEVCVINCEDFDEKKHTETKASESSESEGSEGAGGETIVEDDDIFIIRGLRGDVPFYWGDDDKWFEQKEKAKMYDTENGANTAIRLSAGIQLAITNGEILQIEVTKI